MRRRVAAMLIASIVAIPAAYAAEPQNFSSEAFKQAQAAGKPILIDVTASWCPTCKAQAPIIEELASRKKFESFVILEVDFDDQVDIVRELGARSQSTLIVFKGAVEVDRSVGETNPDAIEALMSKALDAS